MTHIHYICSDAIPAAIDFLGNLLPFRNDPLSLSEVDDNISVVNALGNSVYDFTLSLNKAGVNRIPFSVLHFLNDDLFG